MKNINTEWTSAKYIFKLFFLLCLSIIATSCNNDDEPDIKEVEDNWVGCPGIHPYYMHQIWQYSNCIMPFECWIERSYYALETGDTIYQTNEYSVKIFSPLTDIEKEELQIEVDETLLDMPWYKLLKNGKECDILLFCYDPIDLSCQMPDVSNRKVYAYSKSLKKVFTAYQMTSRLPIYAEEYGETGILPHFYTYYNYIGVDDTNSMLSIKKDKLYMYGTHQSRMQYNNNYGFIITAFDKDMNVWCDAFDMIESKYGRMGIKDGKVPPQNLVRTDVIECKLGAMGGYITMGDAYNHWYNDEYLTSVRPKIVEEYKALFPN